MDLETSFMGFIMAFDAKINDFWSNIETLYHLTTSIDHVMLQLKDLYTYKGCNGCYVVSILAF